jgi:putative hydrolase of the HAD superfamily
VIPVVLFDLDDTLFAHRQAVDDGIVAHLRSLGGDLALADPSETVSRWHALEEHHYPRYLAGELDFAGQRRERAREFLAGHGREIEDAAADAWFAAYSTEYQRAWRLHADTLPCLDALAPTRLGIITNGDPAVQGRKLAAIGLDGRFEHVIASGSFTFAKPDARIFEAACAAFGVPVGQAMYVGDRLATDAIGAARAGLAGVWLDRLGATADETAAAEVAGVSVIHSLREVPGLVRSLGS